jgi:hypothetical protein
MLDMSNHKPLPPRLASNCHDPQSFPVYVFLDGYYYHMWKFISFFRGEDEKLQTFERT